MYRRSIRSGLRRVTPLREGMRVLKSAVARRRQNAYLLEGRERNSQQPLSVLFAGTAGTRNYIADVIFGSEWRETSRYSVWKRSVLRHARAAGGRQALAIIESDAVLASPPCAAAGFQVPCWVGGEKNLATAAEFARHSTHIKSDIRRIRKHGLHFRVTREAHEFDRFYHAMYLPYISRIFGDTAFLMSREEMQAALPQCELFLVTHNEQDIAGGILVYDDSDCVRGWSLGVRDGDDRWVRLGALAAFEHLQTGYLRDKGVRRLHRGGSRPFLNDGALRFKKNRGMELTEHTAQSFVILPLLDCAGVRGFLQHNPFIYLDDGVMKGAAFLPQPLSSGQDVSKLFRDLYIPGLDSLTLFCPGDAGGGTPGLRDCGYIDSSGKPHERR
jgi:hypothetical protein